MTLVNPDTQSGTLYAAWFADFLDVPQADPFHAYVEKIFRDGMTAGCSGGNYCRNAAVSRAQMAVFLLKSKLGAAHVPPACAGIFGDVPCPSLFADWVEELYALGVTGGCSTSPLLYCPSQPVTRAQMAVVPPQGLARSELRALELHGPGVHRRALRGRDLRSVDRGPR